jgi:lipid-binding SYLF domain-containing protein
MILLEGIFNFLLGVLALAILIFGLYGLGRILARLFDGNWKYSSDGESIGPMIGVGCLTVFFIVIFILFGSVIKQGW